MRILFDNGTPRGVASALLGHIVEEARLHGWDTLRNSELLDAAEAAGFELPHHRSKHSLPDVIALRPHRDDRVTKQQQNLKIFHAISHALAPIPEVD